MKVRCIENRFSLRMVGPDRMGFVRTDTPNPSLVMGKIYDVICEEGELIWVADESCEGALWPAEYFEWVEDGPQDRPEGRVIPFRRKSSSPRGGPPGTCAR